MYTLVYHREGGVAMVTGELRTFLVDKHTKIEAGFQVLQLDDNVFNNDKTISLLLHTNTLE